MRCYNCICPPFLGILTSKFLIPHPPPGGKNVMDDLLAFLFSFGKIAYATDETNLWLSPSAKQSRNPCSGPSPVYQDFSTHHDWSVKKAIVDLPIRMQRDSKRISGDLLSPLWAQNKDLALHTSQTLLKEVKLRRLVIWQDF